MPKYVCKHDVKHDGKEYAPGKIIELTEEQAQAMSNAVEPYVPPEEEEKPVLERSEGKGKGK